MSEGAGTHAHQQISGVIVFKLLGQAVTTNDTHFFQLNMKD